MIATVIDQERSDIACRTERSLVVRHAENLAQARLEHDFSGSFALAV
jgi:RNA polymerase subunit RPABC4/transcription elongation factor Spt4